MCNGFSSQNMLRHTTSIVLGRLHNTSVAVRFLRIPDDNPDGLSALKQWLDGVSQLSHPHVLPIIGACLQPAAIVCRLMKVSHVSWCLEAALVVASDITAHPTHRQFALVEKVEPTQHAPS